MMAAILIDPGYEMEETRCIPRGFDQKGGI